MLNKNLKIISIIYIFICIIFCSLKSTANLPIFPLQTKYILTSNYGYRSFDNSFHHGIDCAAQENTPIYTMFDGIVTYSGFDNSGGNMLIIQYNNGYKSMYCHLSENMLYSAGENVTKGTVVGYIGPKYLANGKLNGNTTGAHLHFGLYKNGTSIDPLSIEYE